MGEDFKITRPCSTCGGDGMRPVWGGGIDEEGDPIPPGDAECPYCVDGKRTVGTVIIPQLDALVSAVAAMADQVQALYDDLNP